MDSYYFVILTFLLLPCNSNRLNSLTRRQFKNERQAIALIRDKENHYSLARPELINGQFKFPIKKKESIEYFCSNEENSKLRPEKNKNTKSKLLQYLECIHSPNVVLRQSSTDDEIGTMWPNHNIYQIGYEIMDKTDTQATSKRNFKNVDSESNSIQLSDKPNGLFVPLIRFVYDDNTLLPIFVKYDITSAQSLALQTSYMLNYNKLNNKIDGEMDDIDEFYKYDISEENNRLRQRNQPPNNKVHLESSSLYLIKKQLVPHDDLLLLPWKAAAFYDALTAPIWNVLKTKWEVVEQFIRRLANVLGALEVYTGVRKSLEWYIFSNIYKGPIQLYYEANSGTTKTGLSVPSYFWKAIIHRQRNLGALIVMNNQLFSLSYENLCKDISSEHYWPIVNKDMRSGTIYVCELNNENMKKVLSDNPNFNVNKLELDGLQSDIPLDVLEKIIDNIY